MRIGAGLVVLAACSSTHAPAGDAALPPLVLNDQLDVLFVVDNAMNGDIQTVLASNFANFVQALDGLPGGRPDLHVGFVDSTIDLGMQLGPGCPSPDPNDNGLLQSSPRVTGCSPPHDRYIIDSKGTKNYTGTLQDTMSCIAQIGAAGCGYRGDLEGMKRALDGSRPENAGFLRDSASLLVVFLTDEDDCSVADQSFFQQPGVGTFRCTAYSLACDRPISTTQPGTYSGCQPSTSSYFRDPGDYVSFLRSIKDPRRIEVAVIAGTPSSTITTTGSGTDLRVAPACSAMINGNLASALAGERFAAMTEDLGSLGKLYTVCQSDYSAAVADIAQRALYLLAH